MACSLPDRGCPSQGPRLKPFHCRPLIHRDLLDIEAIHIHLFLSGICNGRFQEFDNDLGRCLFCEAQEIQGLFRLFAPYQISHQSSLSGRYPNKPQSCPHFHFSATLDYAAFPLIFVFRSPAWPWKVRVGENSPSLCPTISSVTKTGMNFFPL